MGIHRSCTTYLLHHFNVKYSTFPNLTMSNFIWQKSSNRLSDPPSSDWFTCRWSPSTTLSQAMPLPSVLLRWIIWICNTRTQGPIGQWPEMCQALTGGSTSQCKRSYEIVPCMVDVFHRHKRPWDSIFYQNRTATSLFPYSTSNKASPIDRIVIGGGISY